MDCDSTEIKLIVCCKIKRLADTRIPITDHSNNSPYSSLQFIMPYLPCERTTNATRLVVPWVTALITTMTTDDRWPTQWNGRIFQAEVLPSVSSSLTCECKARGWHHGTWYQQFYFCPFLYLSPCRGGDDGNAVERMTSRVFLCSKATSTCTCCDRAEQEEEEHDARDPAEYFMPWAI